MKKLFAVVGLAAFIAACSDSNVTTLSSRAQHGALFVAGDPPSPPVGGSGSGFMNVGDAGGLVAGTASAGQCNLRTVFHLSYDFSYLQSSNGNNTVAHLTLTGSTTGAIDVHRNQTGGSDIHGHVSNGSFDFNIQGGDGTLSLSGFDFSLNGIITSLSTGQRCSTTGSVHGTLVEEGLP